MANEDSLSTAYFCTPSVLQWCRPHLNPDQDMAINKNELIHFLHVITLVV